MGPCEFSAIKYLTRWKDKGGVEDLRKAINSIEQLIQMEEDDQRTKEQVVQDFTIGTAGKDECDPHHWTYGEGFHHRQCRKCGILQQSVQAAEWQNV